MEEVSSTTNTTPEEIRSKEAEMTSVVDNLVEKFEALQDEFEKQTALLESFESECKRLSASNDLYKQLAHKTKKLIDEENLEVLKRLYVSVLL